MIVSGVNRRSKRNPCWPWLYGDHITPVGKTCKICWYTFRIGGFSKQHDTLEDLRVAMSSNEQLACEWTECTKEMIKQLNNGTITQKLRGKKKGIITAHFVDVRKKTVEAHVSEGLRSREKFRAISVDRWRQLNPGKCPKDEGMLVKSVKVPGSKNLVECVLVRKKPKREWDLELDVDTRVLMREEVDDGSHVLRAGQQKSKYDALAGNITGTLQGDVKAIDEEAYQKMLKGEKPPAEVNETEQNGPDENSDEEENEDDLAFSDLIPNIQTKAKPKAKAKQQPKTKLAQPKQATVEVERKTTGPATSPRTVASPARVGHTQDQSGKGRSGKGGRIPQDVEGMLKFDGFDSIEDSAHKLVDKLSLKPFISVLATPRPSRRTSSKMVSKTCWLRVIR